MEKYHNFLHVYNKHTLKISCHEREADAIRLTYALDNDLVQTNKKKY